MLASCSAGRVPQQRKGEGALVGPCIKECGHCGGPVDGTGADCVVELTATFVRSTVNEVIWVTNTLQV